MKYVIVVILILAAAGAAVYFLVLNKQQEQAPKPKAAAEKPADKPADKPEEKELTDDEKEQLAMQKYRQIESLSKQEASDDQNYQMAQLKQEIIDLVGTTSPTAMEAHQLVVQANTRLKDAAQRAFENLKSKVKEEFDKLCAEEPSGAEDKEYQYNRVLQMVDEYPAKFAKAGYLEKLEELKAPIRKAARASAAWEPIRGEANNLFNAKDYNGAIAKLEEYPEEFRESEWESVRQKTLKEYRDKQNVLETEKKKEEELTYYELFNGQELKKLDWSPEGSNKVQDGVLVMEAQAGQDAPTSIGHSNSDGWRDFVLRLKMRLVTGTFTIGVRGTELRPGYLTYDSINLSTGEMEANKWYTMSVRVRGPKFTITADPQLRFPVEFTAQEKYREGPIAIFVKGGTSGSIIHIRSILVAFYDKVPAKFAAEAAKQQQDGRAKKLGAKEEEKKDDE